MSTSKTKESLTKTGKSIEDIKKHLEPVVRRLRANAFEHVTAQAQATVALSVGMMKYMGARLQGLDRGRKADDPLRKELNQMRKVLAEIKAKHAGESSSNDGPEGSNKKRTSDTAPKALRKTPAASDKKGTVAVNPQKKAAVKSVSSTSSGKSQKRKPNNKTERQSKKQRKA